MKDLMMDSIKKDGQTGTPNLMIVENHDLLRASLRDLLSINFPDCSLIEAKSAQEALSLAAAFRPHVIVMDIGLPKMKGLEAVRRIKKILPHVKVVMFTTYEYPEYKDDALAAGASACIPQRNIGRKLIPIMADLLSSMGEVPLP